MSDRKETGLKKVIVFFYQSDSREAVEYIVGDLRQAFDDLVEFPVIYLDDFSWEESLQADAYLIYSSRMRSLLRGRVDAEAKMLPMKLVPHLRAAGLAATIQDGSDVLVINDNFASSVETAHQFYDYGVSELALIPYDPDQLASGAYDHIDTAITAGESHRVPPHIIKVIDIGHRLVAISTIMQLIQLLDVATARVQRNFIRRASPFIAESIISQFRPVKVRIALSAGTMIDVGNGQLKSRFRCDTIHCGVFYKVFVKPRPSLRSGDGGVNYGSI